MERNYEILQQFKLRCSKFWSVHFSVLYRFWSSWSNLEHYLAFVCSGSTDLRHLRAILALIACRCVQITWMGLLEPETEFQQLIHHDMALFYGYPFRVNLLATCFGLQTVAFLAQMYRKPPKKASSIIICGIVRQILFEPKDCTKFFLNHQKSSNIVEIIRKSTRLLLLICRYFFAIIGAESAYFYYYVGRFILLDHRKEFFDYGLLGFVHLILAMVSAILNSIYFVCFSLVNINATVVIFVFTWVCFVRLKQVNSLLSSNLKYFTPSQLNRFILLHTETLGVIFAGNAYFGPLLACFILLYIPINTYMLMHLILGTFSPIQAFVFSNVLVFQSVYIFGFHLMAASYTARIHKCRKGLFHWSAVQLSNQNLQNLRSGKFYWWPLQARLRLQAYLFRFHCRRRYGITYGSLGLMSFRSFTKFLLIYAQFIMYCYQLIEMRSNDWK